MRAPGKISAALQSAYKGLALFALIHVALVTALLLYGWWSGRLDRERVEQLAAVMRGGTASDVEDEAGSTVVDTPEGSAENSAKMIREAIVQEEMQLLRAERALADLRQFGLLVDRRALKLQKQQEQHRTDVASHRDQLNKLKEQRLSDAHRKTIATIAGLDAKKSRDYLMKASPADAVTILLELPDRKRKGIFGSCKTQQEAAWRDGMLNAMLKQPALVGGIVSKGASELMFAEPTAAHSTAASIASASGAEGSAELFGRATDRSVSPQRPGVSGERGESTGEVDQVGGFEELLVLMRVSRQDAALTRDAERLIRQANQRAATNERVTAEDLRVVDQQRNKLRSDPGRRPPGPGYSAVAVERGTQGKGSLGYLYRPGQAQSAIAAPGQDPALTPGDAQAQARGAQGNVEQGPRSSTAAAGPTTPGAEQPTPPQLPGGRSVPQPANDLAAQTAKAAPQGLAVTQQAPRSAAVQATGPRLEPGAAAAVRGAGVRVPMAPGSQAPGGQSSEGGVDLRGGKASAGASQAAGSSAKPAALSPDVQTKTINEVVRVMRARLTQQHSVIKLQLSPPELGRLTIEMQLDRNVLSIKIQAENAEVRTLLEQSAGTLAEALQDRGIAVERFEVTLADSGSDLADFGDELQAQSSAERSFSEADRDAAEDSSAEDAVPAEDEPDSPEVEADSEESRRSLDIKA